MQASDTSAIVDRVLAGLENSSLFIDPIIEPGMAEGVRDAAGAAIARCEARGVPAVIVLIPGRLEFGSAERNSLARRIDRHARETSPGAPTISVLAMVEHLSVGWAGIVSEGDGGGADVLDYSQLWEVEDRVGFTGALEFAVAQCLAEATGGTPPEMPPADEPLLDRSDLDYLVAPGDPDGIVAVTAFVASAVGLAWLIGRRNRQGWRYTVTRVSSVMTALAADSWRDTGTPVDLPKEPTSAQVDAFDRIAVIDSAIGVLGSTLGLTGLNGTKAVRAALATGAVEDVVGLVVLGRARRAAAAQLRSTDAEEPPKTCFFHPLHSEATRERSWKTGRRRLTVPCCSECAGALEKEAEPKALMVSGRRGKPTPYFTTDSVYARTGYGAFRPLEAALVEGSATREAV